MNPVTYLGAFAMWLAMTAFMMAPVVYPWLRALGRIPAGKAKGVPTSIGPFVTGYGVAWAGFSAVAAWAQVSLSALGIPVPFGLEARAPSAAVLMLAGGYQLTGFKKACLVHCRSPAGYLLLHWRDGVVGRAQVGLGHGLYCVGCCWALMALAFVAGMANLVWMALLMAVMLAETTLPFGSRLTRPVGIALLALGGGVLVL